MRKKLVGAGLILVAGLGAAGWFLHKPMMVRYYVSRLATDDGVIEPLANLGPPAEAPLLELLRQDTPATPRAGQALAKMIANCPKDDPRRASLAGRIGDSFADFSPAGKQAVLQLAESLPSGSREGTAIVKAALKDSSAASQVQAIIIAMKPEFGLGADVLPLLSDHKPEVRRSAIMAVGALRELVADELLLPSLHDPDADVRGLCEAALRGRGLRDKDIRLGRMVTDPSPLRRLEVLQHLPVDADLDPGVWLQRLCQDPSPLVRASAARYAMDSSSRPDAKLAERVREMARHDPDGTVRQIAEYLITSQPAIRSEDIQPH